MAVVHIVACETEGTDRYSTYTLKSIPKKMNKKVQFSYLEPNK